MFLFLTQTGIIHQNCFLFRDILKPTVLSIPGEMYMLICKEIMALFMPSPDLQSVSDFGSGSLAKARPTAQPSQKAPGFLWSYKTLKVIITIKLPSRKIK